MVKLIFEFLKNEKIVPSGGFKIKKKGQDRNPAHFKIQYPMKNHNNIYKTYTNF